jgi:hypothetical protein
MVFDGAYPMDGNLLTFGTDDDNTAAEQNARDFVAMAKKCNCCFNIVKFNRKC